MSNPLAIKRALLLLLQVAILGLCSFLSIQPANAFDLDVRSSRSSRLDFSVIIERASLDLDNKTTTVEMDLTRFGIVSIEVPATGAQFGLLLGYAYADFSGSAGYESIAMDGYYLGVSVRVNIFNYNAFTTALQAHYLYQSVDGKDDQATASLSWDEFSAALMLKYRVGAIGELYGSINAVTIDGRYRYDGLVTARDDLKNHNQQGAQAGFNYNVNQLETVGINYQRGVFDGFSLQFRKLF